MGARLWIVVTLLMACGGPITPSSILLEPEVQAALKDANSRVAMAGEECLGLFGDSMFYEAFDYGQSHSTDPKWAALDVQGTLTFAHCRQTATSDKVPDGSACGGQITFSEQMNGTIKQSNVSASSTGSGDVMLVAGGSAGNVAWIFQTNHAIGAGCTQEIVNLIQAQHNSATVAGPNTAVIFTVIKSSTCAAPKWKCSNTFLTR